MARSERLESHQENRPLEAGVSSAFSHPLLKPQRAKHTHAHTHTHKACSHTQRLEPFLTLIHTCSMNRIRKIHYTLGQCRMRRRAHPSSLQPRRQHYGSTVCFMRGGRTLHSVGNTGHRTCALLATKLSSRTKAKAQGSHSTFSSCSRKGPADRTGECFRRHSAHAKSSKMSPGNMAYRFASCEARPL